jgi:hypothetical protein
MSVNFLTSAASMVVNPGADEGIALLEDKNRRAGMTLVSRRGIVANDLENINVRVAE